MPIARPMSTREIPWRSTIVRTLPRCAPSAIRIPNSCVRWLTENAMTPAIPAAVMTSASRAKSPSSAAVSLHGARDAERTSATVRK